MLRTGSKMALANIGDSRGYLLRAGTLTQITRDHSYVQSLLDALTRLPKLRVLARSTVMRFKARLDEPIAIGRELNVEAVVTGRLRLRRDDVRVNCELVRVADGARLWGQQYERPLSDLPLIRDEIGERARSLTRGTGAVIDKINAKLKIPTDRLADSSPSHR